MALAFGARYGAPLVRLIHKAAFFGSLKLIGYGLAGIVHAFLPEIRCLQFYTSTGIILAFKAIAESGRHEDEITRELMPKDWQ